MRSGTFVLRGVRSALARKHLAAMRAGDFALDYHSQQERAVVGLMRVTGHAYPYPTSADPSWLTCDFTPISSLTAPMTLERIRHIPALSSFPILRQPRVAVLPLSPLHFVTILTLTGTSIPDIPLSAQQPIIHLVTRILEAKKKDVIADVSDLEQEVDREVSRCYGLTDLENTRRLK